MTLTHALESAAGCTDDLDLWSFRAHANIRGIDDSVLELMDTVADLAQDSAEYRHLFATCDHFDMVAMARWAHHNGIIEPGVLRAVEVNRTPYLAAEEVRKRMNIARGACPMCGHITRFSEKGAHGQKGYHHAYPGCGHFVYNDVSDTAIVYQPKAWMRGRWPYFMGETLAKADGTPKEAEHPFLICCQGCRKTSALDYLQQRVEDVLLDLVRLGRDRAYWDRDCCPTDEIDGDAKTASPSDALPEMLVKRIQHLAYQCVRSDHRQIALSKAGCTVHFTGVDVDPRQHIGQIRFDMSVLSDIDYFGKFRAYANEKIEGLKMHRLRSSSSKIECEAV
jgi:hypothetical protein